MKKKKTDVLIVGAGVSSLGKQTRASLSAHGLKCSFIDNDRGLNERDFLKQIKEKAAAEGVQTIIPVFNPQLLARHRAEFPGIRIPVDSEEKLNLLDNKISACALAEKLGILLPESYSTADKVHRYPVVFKRACGHGGDSVYFPKQRRSLENLIRSSLPGSYLITEEIDGEDVSVDALRWDDFFFAGAYRVILPKAKGISVLRESINAPELVETARKILDAADYKGVCGFDFRLAAKDGKTYFLECNPRLSGGMRSQTASGFDVPWLLWRAAGGMRLEKPHFRPGVRTQYIKGTLDYLKRRRRQGRLTLRDILQCVFSGASAFDDFFVFRKE